MPEWRTRATALRLASRTSELTNRIILDRQRAESSMEAGLLSCKRNSRVSCPLTSSGTWAIDLHPEATLRLIYILLLGRKFRKDFRLIVAQGVRLIVAQGVELNTENRKRETRIRSYESAV